MFWHPWSTAAFQRAHASGRPVLLSLVTGWSAACSEMEANVFAAPAVAAAIEAYAVPVRVDADVRPDIAERYGLGGWPTTVWLTPDGEMLSGGTYIDAEVLIARLREVAEKFARDRVALAQHATAARTQRRAPAARLTASEITLDDIRERLLTEYDEEHAGFGREEKFPLAGPIRFALQTGDPDLLHIAVRTLDRIAESEISDHKTGAFYRSADRTWTNPDRAILLDVQADMISVYLEAGEALGVDAYRERALAALEFVHRQLRTRDGAYHHYRGGPVLTDSNARLMRCFVRASQWLGDNRWILAAVDIAEHLVVKVYARASGVAHCLTTSATPRPTDDRAAEGPATPSVRPGGMAGEVATSVRPHGLSPRPVDDRAGEGLADPHTIRPGGIAGEVATSVRPHLQQRAERPSVFGLSADSILMAAALLDLGEAVGQNVYVELAEELTRSCLRRFWDPTAGALVDRLKNAAGAGDVGLLGESLRLFGINVDAARLLHRLAARTDDQQLAARAQALRHYVGVTAWNEGILSSDYGLLLLEGLVVHSDSGG